MQCHNCLPRLRPPSVCALSFVAFFETTRPLPYLITGLRAGRFLGDADGLLVNELFNANLTATFLARARGADAAERRVGCHDVHKMSIEPGVPGLELTAAHGSSIASAHSVSRKVEMGGEEFALTLALSSGNVATAATGAARTDRIRIRADRAWLHAFLTCASRPRPDRSSRRSRRGHTQSRWRGPSHRQHRCT